MGKQQRKYLGSPIFSGSVPALGAGEVELFDFNERAEASQKYAPFNFITIINNDVSNPLNIYINQDKSRPVRVPASSIRTFDKKSFPAIWSVLVENAGTTSLTADESIVEVQKEVVDGETIIQSFAQKWFGGL